MSKSSCRREPPCGIDEAAELLVLAREAAVEVTLQLWRGEGDLVAEQGADGAEGRTGAEQQGQRQCEQAGKAGRCDATAYDVFQDRHGGDLH